MITKYNCLCRNRRCYHRYRTRVSQTSCCTRFSSRTCPRLERCWARCLTFSVRCASTPAASTPSSLANLSIVCLRYCICAAESLFSMLTPSNYGLPQKEISLLQVLLSPDYLPAMRRRRSSDPMGDTASNLGNAMDELMRHQPSLKQAATKAIITLLEEVI